MAQVLLVDPNDAARKTVRGILDRGGHRFAAADSAASAFEILRRNIRVDLIVTELKLTGDENGLALVRALKAHPLFASLPIVIYAAQTDRDVVKRALDLRVQNFLVKPFSDEALFQEIERAEETVWRNTLFEEEKSFCRLMGLEVGQLHQMLDEIRTALGVAIEGVRQAVAAHDHALVLKVTNPVRDQAEAAGAWGVVEVLNRLTLETSAGSWSNVPSALTDLETAVEFVAHWLDPQRACPDFLGAGESPEANALLRERAAWLAAPTSGRCPVVTWQMLQRELDALTGCPVIDSAAAAFQMAANGHPSCINPLMDLVARDPGLAMQMLISANRHHPSTEDFNRIEDARLAVGQLGELRLVKEADQFLQINQLTFALEPAMTWASYWTFQRAVARIAQLICRDFEFESLDAPARAVGQMHDLGTLLLAYLRPAGLQAVLEHARVHRVRLREVEKLYLGCTTPQMAAYFADKNGLSRRFANVMRWLDCPAEATEDRQLVAIVAFARQLCRVNRVGTCGDPLTDDPFVAEECAEWQILREWLYPSFNLQKFERKVHVECERLREEFAGHRTGSIGELIAHSVN